IVVRGSLSCIKRAFSSFCDTRLCNEGICKSTQFRPIGPTAQIRLITFSLAPAVQSIPQQPTQSYPDTGLEITALPPGGDPIYPQQLEDVLQSPEHFLVVVIVADVDHVEPPNEVPVEPAEQRYLV